MEGKITLSQGGIYLAKLDPAKTSEVGKIRPVAVLTASIILEIQPEVVFVCPLSSQSYPEFRALHVELPPRDNLKRASFALVEHCRSISLKRITMPRLAQLTQQEMVLILSRLQTMVGLL